MTGPRNGRRLAGNLLIVVGVLILVGLGGCYGWQAYRGQQLRSELLNTPAPATQAQPGALVESPPALPPTTRPSDTLLPTPTVPPATFSPTPEITRPPRTAPVLAPTATLPAPSPTAISTPVPTASASAGDPVRIVIPDLKIDARVVPMGWAAVQTVSGPQSEWVIPKNEAGHHINSASLGEPGNVVISGHNNIYGRVFENISWAWDACDASRTTRSDQYTEQCSVLNGRIIQLFNAAGQRFDYTITDFYRLQDTGVSLEQRTKNARFMDPTTEPRLTLVTCWPMTSNTHRLIVLARPVVKP